jgi:hypothetical protein
LPDQPLAALLSLDRQSRVVIPRGHQRSAPGWLIIVLAELLQGLVHLLRGDPPGLQSPLSIPVVDAWAKHFLNHFSKHFSFPRDTERLDVVFAELRQRRNLPALSV